jgi:hypothetical protein
LFHEEEGLKSALKLFDRETPKKAVSFRDAFNLPCQENKINKNQMILPSKYLECESSNSPPYGWIEWKEV